MQSEKFQLKDVTKSGLLTFLIKPIQIALIFKLMSGKYPTIHIELAEGKKAYFASDFHLGVPNETKSRMREKRLLNWMKSAEKDAAALFLVGDLFDFWFEYKTVVPKGFVRFLATLAEWTEKGIPVYIFTGNHDLWMKDYLEKELGAKVFHQPILAKIGQNKCFIAHGDGLGPGDTKFKLLKKVFTFPLFQWMFSWLHPDIGISLAQAWSGKSRTDPAEEVFQGKEKEWLYVYARKKAETIDANFFIFGHRHLPLQLPIEDSTAQYINLGDWLLNDTYLEMNENDATLKKWENNEI